MRIPVAFFRVAAVVAAVFPALPAAGPGIGIVTSDGNFLLNNSKVTGNATLTEGAQLRMDGSSSVLRLEGGARVDLSGDASASVYRDKLVLAAGSGDLAGSARYSIEAATLRISSAAPGASGRIVRRGERAVQVGVASGTFEVRNAQGILVANVFPGKPLEFEPQVGGAAPPSSFAGCLLKKQDKWIVYDQTTRIVAELRGSGFEKEWGHRVQVIGTTDPNVQSEVGAQVVDVTTLTRIAEGGCGPVATSIGAQLPSGASGAAPAGGAPAPAGTGMSAGTKVAIIGAVAGGAGAAVYFATRSDRSN